MYLKNDWKSSISGISFQAFSIKSVKESKTFRKWVYLALHQFCFSLVLSLYFGFCLWAYLATVPPFEPRIKRSHKQPSLGFRPLPKNPYSTLLHFKHGMSGNWQDYKKGILDFAKPYGGFGKFQGPSESCTWTTTLNKTQRCHIPVRKWFDDSLNTGCTGPEAFGYIRGKPCVLLKINRVWGWYPEFYYNVTEAQNSKELPDHVKNEIQTTWDKHCKGKGKETEEKCPRLRMVWLHCKGATAADEEYLGPVRYRQWSGFPGMFYPFYNQMLYLSFVTWAQFYDITPGVLITIECKIYAKNIKHDPNNPFIGGTRVEMLME